MAQQNQGSSESAPPMNPVQFCVMDMLATNSLEIP